MCVSTLDVLVRFGVGLGLEGLSWENHFQTKKSCGRSNARNATRGRSNGKLSLLTFECKGLLASVKSLIVQMPRSNANACYAPVRSLDVRMPRSNARTVMRRSNAREAV